MEVIEILGWIDESQIEILAKKLPYSSSRDEIVVDIEKLTFIEVGPLGFLVSRIYQWRNQGKEVSIKYNKCECLTYLQRIDFFKMLSIDVPESFNRHNSQGKFHPLAVISNQKSSLADDISEEVAQAVLGDSSTETGFTDQPPEEGAFEALAYSVSELVKNIQQHSMGDGGVVAQYYQKRDIAKLAIFDNGIGIWESFVRSQSMHTNKIKNDIDAIKLALKGEVSSKLGATGLSPQSAYGGLPENAGVGLTFLTELAKKSGGEYIVISGNGLVTSQKHAKINEKTLGTFVHLSFNRTQLESFGQLLEQIKREVLPLDNDAQQEDLDSLFL